LTPDRHFRYYGFVMKTCTSLGMSAALLVGILAGTSATAHAAPRRPTTGYVISPPSATPRASGKRSIGRGTIVYFRREGGKYTLGEPDSRVDTNNIGQGTLSPFECGDAKWAEVMSCLKATFLPYDVQITDQDPGMQDHIETVVAGSPTEIGVDPGAGGIAPLGCGLAFDNPVDFAFSAVWHCDVNEICWAAAQETAHTLGLDHSIECTDAMTYDRDCSNLKRFRDIDKPCGEDSEYPADQVPPNLSGPRKCQCTGAATQDSHQTLLAIFGARGNTAPTVSFAKPHEGQSVAPGFPIELTVDDDFGLAHVDILVDGTKVDVSTAAPFHAAAPTTLANGDHTLTARVLDAGGLTTEVTIHVQQQPPCVANDDCSATTVCQQQTCVNGPGAPGGLGALCTADGDCDSERCAPGADGSRCVESCDPAASTCPVGFDCLSAGVSSACWPGDDVLHPPSSGGCGCRVGAVAPRASLLGFLLIFGSFALLRRRRRR
jgi:MYXO-CTERM domain-containing protein